MKQTDDLVREFHEATGQAIGRPGQIPSDDLVRHRLRLIREEFKEVEVELKKLLGKQSPEEALETLGLLLKELCDLRYVADGTAVAFGLPYEDAYREVHRSNMTKRFPDGMFKSDKNGKVMKGTDYSPADMTKFVPQVIEEPQPNE